MPDAVWFPEPGRVEIREEPPRPVGAADIRVQAIASGVSAGSELLVYRGLAPPELPPDLSTIGGDFGFPVKFGYANVGRVVEAGARVDVPRVGELVFVHHPHQTEYVVPAEAAVRLPAEVPPELSVFSANLETALTVTLDAHAGLSEAVLVTGQGVLGVLITMLLVRAGARPIITVDPHPLRREASARAGAHHVMAADEEIVDGVREITSGRGADIAIDVSGNPAALQSCIDSVAFAGTVVLASWYGTGASTLTLGGAFHRNRLRMVSSQVSTIDPAMAGRWDRARRTRVVTELLVELPLSELVTHRFPFEKAASAYELLDTHPDECLQVVLDYV